MEKVLSKNKFVLHPRFKERVLSLKNKVDFSSITPTSLNLSGDARILSANGKLSALEPLGRIKLDAKNGMEVFRTIKCLAYDESIEQFQALEGSGFVTCHSIVSVEKDDYLASNCLSFAFYTRSKALLEQNPTLRKIEETPENMLAAEGPAEATYKHDYHRERNVFILNNCPSDSLLLIDGPLISGVKTVFTIQLNDELLERGTIPVFVVKNSTSNLVVDQTPELQGVFNSDLHWANTILREKERTNFFKYTDSNNEKIAKVFCYIKPFANHSPQRIELHEETYYQFESLMPQIMDILLYLYLDQGPETNVQVRPIIIAEKYARETKKMINIRKIMKEANIQATMNQTRGMF